MAKAKPPLPVDCWKWSGGTVLVHIKTGVLYHIDGHAYDVTGKVPVPVYVYVEAHIDADTVAPFCRSAKNMEDGRFVLWTPSMGLRPKFTDHGLKKLRERSGLTQHALGKLAGCSRSRISHIEQGFVLRDNPFVGKALRACRRIIQLKRS